MADQLEPGREAYHRYGRVVAFRTFDGRRLLAFEELPTVIQLAWVAAGTLPQSTTFIDEPRPAAERGS